MKKLLRSLLPVLLVLIISEAVNIYGVQQIYRAEKDCDFAFTILRPGQTTMTLLDTPETVIKRRRLLYKNWRRNQVGVRRYFIKDRIVQQRMGWTDHHGVGPEDSE